MVFPAPSNAARANTAHGIQTMKRILPLLALAACLGLFTAPLLTGCASASRTTYNVVAGTYYTVDAAMTAWGDYVRFYKPTVTQEQKVAQAYKSWQAASVTVIDTARMAGSDKTTVEKVTAAASAALSGLIAVLQPYGINLVIQNP